MLTHRIIRTIPSGTTTAAGSNLAGIDRASSDHGMASARDPVLDACGLGRPFAGDGSGASALACHSVARDSASTRLRAFRTGCPLRNE